MRKVFLKRILLLIAISVSSIGMAQAQLLYKAGLLFSGLYKAYEAYTLTDEDLAEAVSGTIAQLDQENKICSSDNKYTKRLNRITASMKEVGGLKLNFKVYNDSKTVNAFACPDGSIRVYSGLMDIMSDDEVLGVLSHELGHVACKHSKNAYKNALIASAARDGLMMSDGAVGLVAASVVGDLTEVLLNAKYSRIQETEADEFGYKYLKKIGKNPTNMALALRRLKECEEGEMNKYAEYVFSIFSSHPALDERIEHLDKIAEADGYTH